ncbi:MAG: GAF domain-containing protein [Sphingobium sp.]
MMSDIVEAAPGRLPILPGDWRKHAPQLCEGVDADYLLLDLGPATSQPRYTIIGLRDGAYVLHFCEALSEVEAAPEAGGLGVQSSLFVPLHREENRHLGHVAALYRDRRTFDQAEVAAMQVVARRIFSFLTDR